MKLVVLKGMNLNTEMYRGYAEIADLARLSDADPFNQDTNPSGLQRDLSEKHSREAYRYAIGTEDDPAHKRAWAEVLLNVRDPSVVKITPLHAEIGVYELEILEERINDTLLRPQISRTDGNHRLNFGEGMSRLEWDPLHISTPFAITIGLPTEAESYLFMDINDNQKAMNTSHLAHLRARLTDDEKLAADDPALWIAEKFTEDTKSPWFGIVHKGGKRTQGTRRRVNLAALRSGVNMTLHDTVKLRDIESIESKYVLIRMFWNAVAHTFAHHWANEKSMLLKGIGIWTFSLVGADIIDRCLVRGVSPGSLETEMDMYLRQTRMVFDWESDDSGSMKDYGGRSGAQRAAAKMKAALSDENVNISLIANAVRNMG